MEQNIVICRWRAGQLFAEAEVWGKQLVGKTLRIRDI